MKKLYPLKYAFDMRASISSCIFLHRSRSISGHTQVTHVPLQTANSTVWNKRTFCQLVPHIVLATRKNLLNDPKRLKSTNTSFPNGKSSSHSKVCVSDW